MARYLYWTINTKTGKNYNFISLASLHIGTLVKDENNDDCIIVDMAEEPEATLKFPKNYDLMI